VRKSGANVRFLVDAIICWHDQEWLLSVEGLNRSRGNLWQGNGLGE